MASIRKLDPIVASRIAAGEVVERPSSVLRELLDNSIDAGASRISVYLEQGGIRSLTVIDNGSGMSAQDLELSCVSHATSKVFTLEDLFNLKTMGFRGEALSSIAACSRLTINSNGNRIIVDNGVQGPVVPGGISSGTSVCMEGLFENIPARKLFLKRPQSETADCRRTFMEKALGFEDIEFLFFVDGTLTIHLQKADRVQRAVQVMSMDKAFSGSGVLRMEYTGDNMSLLAVSSDPSTYKRDRSQIRIFVNNRVIDCYQFVQAVTNAYSAALPGGAFPFFYLYITDEPALVDFNIHPAKRECKIRNQSQIYGCITSMIRKALIDKNYSTDGRRAEDTLQSSLFSSAAGPDTAGQSATGRKPANQGTGKESELWEKPSTGYASKTPSAKAPAESKPFDPSWFENARKILSKPKTQNIPEKSKAAEEQAKAVPAGVPSGATSVETLHFTEESYRYVGQVFNTFLIVETESELLFLDQHALHERILYDEIRALKDVQHLMIPYEFEVDRSVDEYLQQSSVLYSDFGIELTRKEPLLWEMGSLPAACRSNEDKIVSYIQTMTGDIDSVQKGLFAIIACHAAIKAGDRLDQVTARMLVKKAFEMERMVCPHGRSFTCSISKDYLYREVGRLV